MGKANIYLILIVIIIPVFFVSGQNGKIENTTNVFSENNIQLLDSFHKSFSENKIRNIKILSDNNSSIVYETDLRGVIPINQKKLVDLVNIVI